MFLQYTAQPLPNHNLLQQGTGSLNVPGAVELASALRTDLSNAIANGTIASGNTLLASGKTMPTTSSTVADGTFNWSKLIYVGGNRIVSGSTLFTKYHPLWDPRLVWANGMVRQRTPVYWSGTGIAANTYVNSFSDVQLTSQTLLASGPSNVTALAGTSSLSGKTGAFIPTATLSGWTSPLPVLELAAAACRRSRQQGLRHARLRRSPA